jgi:hypothetical protein
MGTPAGGIPVGLVSVEGGRHLLLGQSYFVQGAVPPAALKANVLFQPKLARSMRFAPYIKPFEALHSLAGFEHSERSSM